MSRPEDLDTQRLISELTARENSTLVFSTVAASVSLAILAVVLPINSFQTKEWFDLAFWAGVLFPLVGIFYRELTIFLSDIPDYKELNRRTERQEAPRRRRFSILARMTIVRFFLLLPIGGWLLIKASVFSGIGQLLVYFFLFMVAISFSIVECIERKPQVTSSTRMWEFRSFGLIFLAFLDGFSTAYRCSSANSEGEPLVRSIMEILGIQLGAAVGLLSTMIWDVVILSISYVFSRSPRPWTHLTATSISVRSAWRFTGIFSWWVPNFVIGSNYWLMTFAGGFFFWLTYENVLLNRIPLRKERKK